MQEQGIRLLQKDNQWQVELDNNDFLTYNHYDDAVVSMGILAKEILKIFKVPVKTSILFSNQQSQRQSYLYPNGYLQSHHQLSDDQKKYSKI